MANLIPNYNRESFFANLRANGYTLTQAEEERAHNLIVSQGRDNGFFAIIRQGLSSAWRLVQALFETNSNLPLGERINAALTTADRFGSQREVNEVMHSLRDNLASMGGNIAAAASAMTGDTSNGQPIMRGNLRDVAMANLQPTAAELQRGTRLDVGSRGPQPGLPVVDTNEITPPLTTASATAPTRALTGYAQGA